MKKFFVLLSISYLFAVLFSGCTTNVFSSMDKASKEDEALSAKQDATDALNSGDYSKAISKINEIIAKDFPGITSATDIKDSEKKAIYMDLMSKKGEAILGSAGVETLKIVKIFSEISDKASNPNSTIKITDILGSIDISRISAANDAFAAALPGSSTLTPAERTQFKSSYQSAAIASGLTAANSLQTIANLSFKEPSPQTDSPAQVAWNKSKTAIATDLARTVDNLTVAYTNSSMEGNAIGADSISSIKNKILSTAKITQNLLDDILSGK